VFIPKYRKPILRGEVALAVRDLVREVCKAYDIEILKGHVRPDHVHLLLSVPPTMAPSRVMNAIKGRSSNRLMRNFRELNRQFWGRHLYLRNLQALLDGDRTRARMLLAKACWPPGAHPGRARLRNHGRIRTPPPRRRGGGSFGM